MNIAEKRIAVTMEAEREAGYLQLLHDYFAASELNNRASSIDAKKQMMHTKEQMLQLCHSEPAKLDALKSVLRRAYENREKAVVITRASGVAMAILERLEQDAEAAEWGVMVLSSDLNVHEVSAQLDRFSQRMDNSVLVLTDAASPSLNLSAANHLIHYDYPDTYAQIVQRNNRITRQNSYHTEASIYYMMCEGKIDMLNYQLCMKEGLEPAASL
ncbi:helicase-related protein [Paenibacillus sp. 1P07SE]|uniref:helicase-related protein n=1 Tax=Paenibacillus sp. 1P07SE TaxID=3132209 RepID=UPI0039A47A66